MAVGSLGNAHRRVLTPQARLLHLAEKEVGVREATGNNDGARVESYLRYTRLNKGNPWCAAFVSWVFGQAGQPQPRSAWSPDLVPPSKRTHLVAPGQVFGIYFAEKQRIAHVGLVAAVHHKWVYTIEGNTNVKGSREGDGVYQKWRHQRTIAAFADWLPKERRLP